MQLLLLHKQLMDPYSRGRSSSSVPTCATDLSVCASRDYCHMNISKVAHYLCLTAVQSLVNATNIKDVIFESGIPCLLIRGKRLNVAILTENSLQ